MKKSKDFQEFGFNFKPYQYIPNSKRYPANKEYVEDAMSQAGLSNRVRIHLQELFGEDVNCSIRIESKDKVKYYVKILILFDDTNKHNKYKFDFIQEYRIYINSLLKTYVREAFVSYYLYHLYLINC